MTFRLTTANREEAAGGMRDLVAALCRSSGHKQLAEAARLCTSEVVTNVYRHTRAKLVYVDVTVGKREVSVYVHDDLPRGLPMPREISDGEGGYGLFIVDSLADRWGTAQYGGLLPTSKSVWFSMVEGGRGAS
ncbi:ATP-binding protein [Streptomyces sp. CBMA152]|uniref:ATP-binding protein n=1 Tax=Streptomyces sp. CBMA152 TaxID=1896312 RepID=UPI0016616799|nr:ATP-binding protein [Streptomyces sp. CBMA152]